MVGRRRECAQITIGHVRHETVEVTGRNNPEASVVDADVIERQEAGQELARDTGIAAVLMPRHLPLGARSLGYNLFAAGVGADLKLGPWLRVRGEYEFQKWASFPNGGFTPQIVTIGAAYHFAGRPGYR